LIPSNYADRAVINVEAFNKSIRTASIFARDGRGIVRLTLNKDSEGKGNVTIASRAEEVGENTGVVDAELSKGTVQETAEGDNQPKIAFNSKYISDVLAVLQSNEVALEISSPSNPGVVKPVGQDNYIHVVMPMFVQG